MQRVIIEDGLNASCEKTGIGSYTRRLISSLQTVENCFEIKFVEFQLAKKVKNRILRRLIYIFWKNFLFEIFYLKKGDILHITNFRSSLIKRPGVFRIYTIHDLIAKNYSFSLPAHVRKRAAKVVDRAVSSADEIIVPTCIIKEEILRTYGNKVDADKINIVTYSAISRGEYHLPQPDLVSNFGNFFLFIGTIEVRKNLPTLIAAFESYCFESVDIHCNLVIVGKPGFGGQRVISAIAKSRHKARIHYMNFVSNEMLSSLLHHTTALIFPSLYEGFGLPALEAVSINKPVIASDIPTFRAIGGNCFNFYGEPNDINGLKSSLQLAASGHLNEVSSSKMLAAYTEESVAKTHLKVYQKHNYE